MYRRAVFFRVAPGTLRRSGAGTAERNVRSVLPNVRPACRNVRSSARNPAPARLPPPSCPRVCFFLPAFFLLSFRPLRFFVKNILKKVA